MDWLLTPTGVLLSVLTLLIVVVSLMLGTMFLAIRWTNRMRDFQSRSLQSQLQHRLQENERLINLLSSKDPMTFQVLQAQTSYSASNEDHLGLTPIGTDEAEARRYQELYGKDEGLDDNTDDIAEFLTS